MRVRIWLSGVPAEDKRTPKQIFEDAGIFGWASWQYCTIADYVEVVGVSVPLKPLPEFMEVLP